MHRGKVSTFIFLGFSSSVIYNLPLFTLVLLIYIVTICGNLLIIMLVYYSKTLHTPMYFFLSQLSVSDIMLTTDIVPNMLYIILHERTPISFPGCIIQFYVFCATETFECYLLMMMSYDRYLAICSPLHYVSIMKPSLCVTLVLISWLLGFSVPLFTTLCLSELEFCGLNVIDSLYCDLNPLLDLSCSDTSRIVTAETLLSFSVALLPFLVILVSYVHIVVTILKISSYTGRPKSFSTCSSHLTVVSIFYGTLLTSYLIPKEGQSSMISKIMPMLYTVFTPCLNPFIYTLRNSDITTFLKRYIRKIKNYPKLS